MCGICGVIDIKNPHPREDDVRNMMRIMKHRGPDDEGTFHEDHVHFGFVRLSIIDLTVAGHQPMMSEDGRHVVIFNGLIYNHIELRNELKTRGIAFHTRSDTEVLLAAYREWGTGCLDRFNGMWAFAIYDRREKIIFCVRDRFGVKPFYYLQTDNAFAFASEIPPLLSLLDRKPTPDRQSLYDYLVFNRTDQTENTFFSEVKKLQHGHSLTIDLSGETGRGQKVKIKKWYDLQANLKEPFKGPEEFREALNSAIDLRMRSDVPVGVCLSGGIDSSAIVSILRHNYSKEDLRTFSAVYGKGQTGDESTFINEFRPLLKNMFYTTPTAESLLQDLERFVKAHAEPIPSTAPYAQFKVMELAGGNVVVTIDGQGADEQLAGYHYFYGFYYKELFLKLRWFRLISEMAAYFRKHRSLYAFKAFGFSLLPPGWKDEAQQAQKGYVNPDFAREYSQSNIISSNLYSSASLHEAFLDHFEYKLEHLLKWEDRNSMFFSLEARVPFLDHRLVESALSLSPEMSIRSGMTKHILREAMTGTMPEKIRLRRDKIGFDTPQDEWFRKPAWQKVINDILNDREFDIRGIISPKKAKLLYQRHLSGGVNAAREIWKWIHLDRWHREFIGG
ncbi:MAG TPA: asparagine synthase (glutamine-hydrolyzing) [Syntrophales bacterium]|nr:asparagine synthase (glutamine-hydrolyzing) [Syntrophales bacterium]